MKGLGGADAAGGRSVWPAALSGHAPHPLPRLSGCQASALQRRKSQARVRVCSTKMQMPRAEKKKKLRRVGTEDTQDRRSIERGPVFAFSTPTTNPTHMF